MTDEADYSMLALLERQLAFYQRLIPLLQQAIAALRASEAVRAHMNAPTRDANGPWDFTDVERDGGR